MTSKQTHSLSKKKIRCQECTTDITSRILAPNSSGFSVMNVEITATIEAVYQDVLRFAKEGKSSLEKVFFLANSQCLNTVTHPLHPFLTLSSPAPSLASTTIHALFLPSTFLTVPGTRLPSTWKNS
jgi:hypothetical protein